MAIQNANRELSNITQVVHDVAVSKASKNGRKYLVLNNRNIESSGKAGNSTEAIQEIGKRLQTLQTTLENVKEVKEILSDLKTIATSESQEFSLSKFFKTLFGGQEQKSVDILNSQETAADVKVLKNLHLMQIFGFGITGSQNKNQSHVAEAEILAFYLYTSNAYALINPFLRKQDDVFFETCSHMAGLIKNLSKGKLQSDDQVLQEIKRECAHISSFINSGLAKLSKYEGLAYRGDMMSEGEYQMIAKGNYQDLAYMSFSTSEKVGVQFSARDAKNSEEKHRVLLRVNSKNSHPVKEFAENKDEDEVLYAPGQKFKVVSKREEMLENPGNHQKYKVLIVDLEEN